jgi:transposase
LTIEEWGQEIFAYFSIEVPLTNGFTEAQNRLIRDASRTGFGIGFRTLRAKLLFSSTNTSPTSPKQRHRLYLPDVQPQETKDEVVSSITFSTPPAR